MSLAKSSFAKIASEEQKTFCVAISTLQRGERERERERERRTFGDCINHTSTF